MVFFWGDVFRFFLDQKTPKFKGGGHFFFSEKVKISRLFLLTLKKKFPGGSKKSPLAAGGRGEAF